MLVGGQKYECTKKKKGGNSLLNAVSKIFFQGEMAGDAWKIIV